MVTPLSKIPDVVETLVRIWTEAVAALPDKVEVLDGFGTGAPDRAVIVGVPWETRAPYTSTLTRQQGMRTRFEEAWDVTCMASVLLPGTERDVTATAAARRAVSDLLGVLGEAVRDNPHPTNGAWQRIEISGDVQWMPVLTPDGMACSIIFTTSGDSLL